jgi:hypothetical protein
MSIQLWPHKIAILIVAFAVAQSSAFADEKINFNRDIRPILSDKCFRCHGPDDEALEADLRLDSRDSAIASAIVPGKPDDSELVDRITSDDEDFLMPPRDSEKTLSKKEIELLKKWIEQGAEYQRHWAFVQPERPALPNSKSPIPANWKKNPIDRFTFRRMAAEDLAPAAPANNTTLLRRVTLDLTGLPPTPAEIKAFLADDSPNAYEKVVDRLLSSANYGERMAINWLDYARFADSNGFQSDGSRTMWAWRDWVINAYNRNLPFDQFTIQQIAGDMLPNATDDQIIATGFNRNHRLNGEGGRIVEEWFVETVIDRVETTGLTWLGLTFNCCRCHDHKYDPISQKEFYQLFAYFNSVEESGVLAPVGKFGENTPPLQSLATTEQQSKLQKLVDEIKTCEATYNKFDQQVDELIATWEHDRQTDAAQKTWSQSKPLSVKSLGGATFKRQFSGFYLASGKNPPADTYEIIMQPPHKNFSAFMLEVMPHRALPNQSLGRGSNGNFVLTHVRAFVLDGDKKTPIKLARTQADFAQDQWPADLIDISQSNIPKKIGSKGWAIAGFDKQNRVPRRIMFVAENQIELPDNAKIEIQLIHKSPFADHNIGNFRIATNDAPLDQIKLGNSLTPQYIVEILAVKPDQRTKEQKVSLQKYFRMFVESPLLVAKQKLDQARAAEKKFRNDLPVTMVMKEGQRRDAFILTRGEYDKRGANVERGLPAILPPLPQGQPNDRLGLANWLVDKSNPLTARVWVNREWERFFGTGIVKTTENFGSQADFPSHPDLLDWLACEFMNPTVLPKVNGQPVNAWDMKAMQKLMVTSQTYRQSSRVTPKLLEKDPNNRLLARGPRFRLTGELIRDQALAASGLLVNKIGGPSVRPYMPDKVWDETSVYGNLRNYKHDQGEGLYRRTMYTIWKRTAAPPTMLLFDAPNRETCTIKRSKTNTPLQALSLLNEITFIEAARGLANRMILEGGVQPEQRLSRGFLMALGREPDGRELRILLDGFNADLKKFKEDPTAATKLIQIGESKNAANADEAELAAYILAANIMFNLDEFVTRE